MAVSYKKLFHLLVDRDMTAVQLQQQAGYSANITARLKKDTYISMESMEKICRALNCKLDDIVEFIPDNHRGNGEAL
jgi:DNA-binding Xre family transcriptional regulator